MKVEQLLTNSVLFSKHMAMRFLHAVKYLVVNVYVSCCSVIEGDDAC